MSDKSVVDTSLVVTTIKTSSESGLKTVVVDFSKAIGERKIVSARASGSGERLFDAELGSRAPLLAKGEDRKVFFNWFPDSFGVTLDDESTFRLHWEGMGREVMSSDTEHCYWKRGDPDFETMQYGIYEKVEASDYVPTYR